ncbi:MAG: glycine cleavage system transcriptional repressor [Acidimicrobiales bacterium]
MNHSDRRFLLSVAGVDCPGIVAAVTGALAEEGWNLEDATMSNLRGYFTIMMMVHTEVGVDMERVSHALSAVSERMGLSVMVDAVEDEGNMARQAADDLDPWSIYVHGSDRPGIVHAVASEIARAGGNIVDLSARVGGRKGDSVYIMTIRAVIPVGEPSGAFQKRLSELSSTEGIECSARLDTAYLL